MNTEEFDHNLGSVKMKSNNSIQSFIIANSEGKDIPRKKAAWGASAESALKAFIVLLPSKGRLMPSTLWK